jgi:phosphoribosylformylglycinamidine synthase
MKTVGVIVFPGSNCDDDAVYAIERFDMRAKKIWHEETTLGDVEAIILPGGFSYGDYLRCGAIAQLSPIMRAVRAFAASGGRIIGICNGFQILVEAGLLPGALLRNRNLKFICKGVSLRLETTDTPFTCAGRAGGVYRFPIAHMDGNYFIEADGLRRLEDNGQIVFRYCDSDGQLSETSNPNGSLNHIAGICNETRTILGLMPHPERVCEKLLGGEDGALIFTSLLS